MPKRDLTINLVPYAALTADEKQQLHAWFDAHGVDHRDVPINPRLRFDLDDRMHVEVFSADEHGKRYLRGDGIATEWVSFTPTSPMPWPVKSEGGMADAGTDTA